MPSPTSAASQVSETFTASGMCYFTTTRGNIFSRKAKEPLLVIFVREKVSHFQLQFHGTIEHYTLLSSPHIPLGGDVCCPSLKRLPWPHQTQPLPDHSIYCVT